MKGVILPCFSGQPGMAVSIGKNAGVGVFNGWNIPGWIITYLKSRNLFASKYWSKMNQKMPE